MAKLVVRGMTAALWAVSLAACSSTSETLPTYNQITIDTDKAAYNSGDVVNVTVHNGTQQTVTYNLCQRDIQKQSGTSWSTVQTQVPDSTSCTGEAHTFGPNDVARTTVALPTSLTGGTYRIYFPNLGDTAVPTAQKATPGFIVRVL